MLRIFIGIFMLLHGLVHLWYFVMSRGLVELKPEMGWSGKSWLFTNFIGNSATNALASALYLLVTIGFVAGSIGIFGQQEWWRLLVIGSAALSTVTILLFWDGQMQLLVEKGLLGLVINLIILFALLVLKWPAVTF
jgi:hypothetical protein